MTTGRINQVTIFPAEHTKTITSIIYNAGLENRSYQIRIFPTLPEGKHRKTVH
jgi:hypothetical protein